MLFGRGIVLLTGLACWAAPPLTYSTYLGSGAAAKAWSVATDKTGNAYVGLNGQVLKIAADGASIAATLAAPAGEVRALAVDSNGFVVAGAGNTVTRWTPAGGVVFSTTLAGTVAALAVDSAGAVYCAGSQDVSGKLTDVFVARLSPEGQVLSSTTFGGTQKDDGIGIAVDANGNTYITGRTLSSNFPRKGGVQGGPGDSGFGDAFLTKLGPDGTTIVYSTYIGWFEADAGRGVAVDARGAAYVTGSTGFIDEPRNGFQTSRPGGLSDAFVAKISPAGDAYEYLSYLGGSDVDDAYGITVDAAGSAYVTGETFSTNFPILDAWQARYGGTSTNGDAFLTKVSPDGKSLVWSTYIGGSGGDHGHAVAVDSGACVLAAGFTGSFDFPLKNALQKTYGGAFALKACGPALTAEGIINAASYKGGGAAPGEMLTIYGDGFGPDRLTWYELTSESKMSTTLAGIRVFFDDTPAPILWALKNRVSVIAPYAIAGRTETVIQLEADGVRSNAVRLPVLAAKPALFTANASGQGQAAARNSDNVTLNALVPAAAGSVVVMYGTGEGQTNPAGIDGQFANSTYPAPLLPVEVAIGGRSARVLYAGAAPTWMAGFLQINALIPADTPPGAATVVVKVGDAVSPDGVTISVK